MNGAEAVGLSAVLVDRVLPGPRRAVTVGAVTAAALLFHRLFGPLGDLLMSFNEIQRAGSALTRLVGVADLPGPSAGPRPRTHGRSRSGPPAYTIATRPVPRCCTTSTSRSRPDAAWRSWGRAAPGKTTLAALLGGVFGASAGRIMIGAESIDDLDPVQLRRRVGVVTQEVHTFVGTLGDDLRLARPDAEDADLLAALRVVGADDWVRALAGRAADGDRVGRPGADPDQAQQVALARLVLVDPPVMILDEATAEAGSAGARQLERAARAALCRPDRRGGGASAHPGPGVRRDRPDGPRPDRRTRHPRRTGRRRWRVRQALGGLERLSAAGILPFDRLRARGVLRCIAS